MAMTIEIPLCERRALSASEVAAAYGVCRATVYNLLNSGKLPSSKVLGRRLIPREACEDLFIGDAALRPDQTNPTTSAA